MKLQSVIYICGNCGSTFRVPEIVGGFGRLLLRSEGLGRPAVLNTFTDPVVDEISELTKHLPLVVDLDDRRKGELGRQLLGRSSDPDEDGSPFGVGVPPRCPVCRSNRMAEWQATDPPEFVDVELPEVTHERWNSLSADGKLRELKSEADDFLSA